MANPTADSHAARRPDQPGSCGDHGERVDRQSDREQIFGSPMAIAWMLDPGAMALACASTHADATPMSGTASRSRPHASSSHRASAARQALVEVAKVLRLDFLELQHVSQARTPRGKAGIREEQRGDVHPEEGCRARSMFSTPDQRRMICSPITTGRMNTPMARSSVVTPDRVRQGQQPDERGDGARRLANGTCRTPSSACR